MSATTKKENQRIPNLVIIWLDPTCNDHNEFKRYYFNNPLVEPESWLYFDNHEHCADYIKGSPRKKIFLIVTGRFGEEMIPELHNLIQLHSVYIYCKNITKNKQWSLNFDKITDVYNDPIKLLVQFQNDIVEYGLRFQKILRINDDDNDPKVNHFSQPNKNWCPWKSNSCTKNLTLKGQGTIEIIQLMPVPFELLLTNTENSNSNDNDDFFGILLIVNDQKVTISKIINDETTLLQESIDDDGVLDTQSNGEEIPYNIYWFSLDSNNLFVKYGTGEIRHHCRVIECYFNENDQKNLKQIKYMHIKLNNNINLNELKYLQSKIKVYIGTEPVVDDPPLLILSETQFTTVEDIVNPRGIPASVLAEPCRILYSYISNFKLNNDDFPQFINAIEQSIQNSNGLCYKKLHEKANRFGKPNLKATYLRITLGKNIGNAPGIPYVLEVWPAGHYSPIHNHGNSYGIIRILYNEILISLYQSLNIKNQKPFIKRLLHENESTWMLPKLNQTHQVSNVSDRCCITLQCYQYGKEDTKHYEYFDYINNDGKSINHFNPISDMDYMEFRDAIKREWTEKSMETL
ncbi:unnamed protein product [Didymodactylos carnosus]|uniref:Cysteine dioxygenase n=1 Tax=Didymodactylos carnosus TaxID=1234261 RepID=A0A815PLG1_9BILA|nr:unnamed protein product [Didymodactylos carnosus]CAF1450461.1 unnamed protein product [Didymodactylos carnosus]CAF3657386.1 unnamed protein product [Didymodactylos carnosus]CAF4323940.1 unnamed protein product [Didymodactylos carnosus]